MLWPLATFESITEGLGEPPGGNTTLSRKRPTKIPSVSSVPLINLSTILMHSFSDIPHRQPHSVYEAEHGAEDGFKGQKPCGGAAAVQEKPGQSWRHTRGDATNTHKGAVERQAPRRTLTSFTIKKPEENKICLQATLGVSGGQGNSATRGNHAF